MSAAISDSMTHSMDEQNGARGELLNPQQNVAGDTTSNNNLEKIREILFGGQLHDFETRFARLEQRLTKLTTDLRDDLTRSLTSIEASVKKDLDSLNERFLTEANDRNGTVKTLSLEFKALSDFSAQSAQKLNQLDEQVTRNVREIRSQLFDQSKVLSEEISQKHSELKAIVDRAIQELQANKTDRATLAAFFSEVATRLSNELYLPGKE